MGKGKALHAGLGWNIIQGSGEERNKSRNPGNRSVFLSGGSQKDYCLGLFPKFSSQEQKLLSKVASLFQKREGEATCKSLKDFFRVFCMQNLILLEKRQSEYLLLALERHLFGFGPMDFFLEDENLEEIAVIGTGREKPVQVFHVRHGWLGTNVFFTSEEAVKDLVNKMSRGIGRRLSMKEPVINAILPDGNRLSAAMRPVSFSGPAMSIRKFRKKPFTPVDLVRNSTFSTEAMAFIWVAMQCECSVLVVGNTGSGKTSSLNSLLAFVPKDERIVLVEETPEIRVQHRHFVKLNVVKEQGVGMQDLIFESLRMRPDRILVGEIRDSKEVAAFVDTLLAGQGKGSYATFHGQDCEEALNRMRCLGILEADLAAIDLVVVQRRWNRMDRKEGNKEIRRAVEVVELVKRNERLEANKVFEFDYKKNALIRKKASTRVFEKAKRSFSFEEKGFSEELEKRKKFLEREMKRRESLEGFFARVNKF